MFHVLFRVSDGGTPEKPRKFTHFCAHMQAYMLKNMKIIKILASIFGIPISFSYQIVGIVFSLLQCI